MAVQRYRKPDGTWGVLQGGGASGGEGGNDVANVYLPMFAELTDDELAKNKIAFEKMKNGASVQFAVSQDDLCGYYNFMYKYVYFSEDDAILLVVDYEEWYISGTTITSVIQKSDWYMMYPDGSVVLDLSASEEPQGGGASGGVGVAQLMTEVTYDELVALRDSASLIPGMFYRITDYDTMTSDIGESAEHPFDIIVTALSNNVIDEKARAIQSARDITGYFANSNLTSWEVWYCLDNNKDRFINASVESNVLVIQLEGESFGGLYDGTIEYDGKSYFSWRMDMGEDSIYLLTINETPQTGDDVIILFGGEFLGNGSVAQHLLMKDGKGVIYRLIDEYGNDIPYDFKNVLVPRKLTNGEYDAESGIDTQCYTFTLYDDATGTISDFSINHGEHCYNNIMGKDCYDNVFLTKTMLLSNEGSGCHSNIIGDGCKRCTFGDQCYGNTLGNDCSDNVAFYNFQNNICGDSFSQNIIGQSCVRNVIGAYFFRNNVGDAFKMNKIGEGCYENIFGSTFNYNELGNNCIGNIFAKTADGAELSIATYFCKLGDGCSNNIIYGDRTYPDKMQNVHIEAGIKGTEENKNIIKIPVMDAPYVQNVAKNSNGEIKIFCIADLVN